MRPSPTAFTTVQTALRHNLTPCSASKAVARPFTTTVLPRASSSSSSSSSSPSSTSSSSTSPPAPKGPIRDESILRASPYVRLVDPKTGSLAGPFDTKSILTKLDRSKFFLQQVAPPQPSLATVEFDPDSPPSDPSQLVQFAICKLIDKKEEFDRQRNAKRKPAPTSPDTPTYQGGSKEVQLTWSVTRNDLSHKLGKAKKELLKGNRINVVVTTKAGGRRYIKGFDAKEDERRERLLCDIERELCVQEAGEEEEVVARRVKDVDWQRGGSAAVLCFECLRR